MNCGSKKFIEQYSNLNKNQIKNNLNRNETWWVLEDIIENWREGLL